MMDKSKRTSVSMLVLIIASIILLFPLIITVMNSFMSEKEITANLSIYRSIFDVFAGIKHNFIDMYLIPREVTTEQYAQTIFFQPTFTVLMLNSIKIVVPIVLGNIVVSLLAAYGFTMWKWKYKEILFHMYMIVMLMPLQAILVPNFLIAKLLHIDNSYLAIILPGIFSPFGTFILRQSLKAMPREYLDAAAIDGAGMMKTLIYIVTPQLKSSLAAVGMLVFIENWNIVEQIIVFIKEYYRQPLSVYLSQIAESRMNIAFAASCIYMLIPLWCLMIGQKDLEKGIELSGIK